MGYSHMPKSKIFHCSCDATINAKAYNRMLVRIFLQECDTTTKVHGFCGVYTSSSLCQSLYLNTAVQNELYVDYGDHARYNKIYMLQKREEGKGRAVI